MMATGFGSFSPLAKLAIWFSGIMTAAAAIQAGACICGADFNILSPGGGGHGVLMGVALASLLVMMAADRRSAPEYGLAVDIRWKRQSLRGLSLGALFYAGYCATAWLLGAFTLQTSSLTAYRCCSAVFAASTAIPVAATQQVIFSGYLLSTLRDRYHRGIAVAVSALLFAVLACLKTPSFLLSGEGQRLMIGMFLIAALLGALRLRCGNIVFPSAVLAGCIAVRRLLRKTRLFVPSGDTELLEWLAPSADPRQSPFLWIAVIAAIAVCWRSLRRHGEPDIASDQQALSASFKRVFPLSNILAMGPLDLWLGRLVDARFRVGLKYIPRLIAILTFSAANTVLSLPERLLLPWLLKKRPVSDPVFVLGVHRSGTTHLHNLLSCDERFCAPRTYHTLNPIGVLFSGWLITPILGAFMTMRRPMDAVRFNILAPQEDEFAIAAMCRFSPYWGATFPRRIAQYDRYIFADQFSERERKAWKRHWLLFLRKLTFWSNKRPLLKSPYHTGRVAALRAIFPKAKFIHISRHPAAVYRSNMHMAREGWVVFQLQDPDERDCYRTRFLDNYRALEEAFYRDTAELPPQDVVEVRLEDLEQDPIGEIRRVYSALGIEYNMRFHRRLKRYVESVAGYRKNRLPELSEDEVRELKAKMGPFFRRWGYERDDLQRAADAA